MKRQYFLAPFASFVLLLFWSAVRADTLEANPRQTPKQVLIQGVPFVSFAEAARLKYPEPEVVNPALPAATGMLAQYWGQKLSLLSKKDWPESLRSKGWTFESKNAQNFDEVKSFLARGIPVEVFVAVTPFGHFLNPAWSAFLATLSYEKTADGSDFLEKLDKENVSTGTLGRMVALEKFPSLKTILKLDVNPIRESALDTPCVLIGYDETRNIVILHSPLFGPAWEVNGEDFLKMWGAYDRQYYVFSPPESADFLAKRPISSPYRKRTAGEQAAFYFLNGYTLASLGKAQEAETFLKKGSAIQEAGKGYEHLFRIELASVCHADKRFVEAVRLLQEAIDLLPENAVAWVVLAHLYQEPGSAENAQKASEAAEKAKRLARDRKAVDMVAKVLPRDFYIPYLGPVRGWAYR